MRGVLSVLNVPQQFGKNKLNKDYENRINKNKSSTWRY